MKAFGLLAMFAAVISAIVLAFGMKSAQSAPQEAAIAALAAAIAIIPYVFYRALQSMKQADELAAIRSLLQRLALETTAAPVCEPSTAHPAASEEVPQTQAPGHVVKSEDMGLAGWQWHQLSNGAIRISDPHGADYNYPSVAAAKAAFTWWQGPTSA